MGAGELGSELADIGVGILPGAGEGPPPKLGGLLYIDEGGPLAAWNKIKVGRTQGLNIRKT